MGNLTSRLTPLPLEAAEVTVTSPGTTPRLTASALQTQLANDAARLGISTWDLGAVCSSTASVQVDRGEPKQLKARQENGVTIRVWNEEGIVGMTSTNNLSPAGLAAALAGAGQASAYGNPECPPRFSPQATAPLHPLQLPLHDAVPIQAMLQQLLDAERQLLNYHPAITTVPYNGLVQSQSDHLYINSDGALRSQHSTMASIHLYALAQESGRRPRSAGAVRVARGIDGLDVFGCLEEAAQRTVSHLDYAPLETGTYTVCFSPDAFLDLLRAFGTMFNAQAVLDGISLSNRESLGTSVASPLLSVFDDARHPWNVGAMMFDGEGTPTRRLPLIETGQLTSFLHSEGTARLFGDGSVATGHASMGAKVSISPSWFDVQGKRGDAALRLQDADGVVLIDSLSALHAGVKASQGSFSLPFDGWLLKAGKRRSIEAATVAGDILSCLRQIVACEGEPERLPDGCSPHVWVQGLTLTGES